MTDSLFSGDIYTTAGSSGLTLAMLASWRPGVKKLSLLVLKILKCEVFTKTNPPMYPLFFRRNLYHI